MPAKHKSYHGDEYNAYDDLESADTLIGRNRVPKSPVKKKTRPISAAATKKKTGRPVTPSGKKKKRPQSAPTTRTGHDLWMTAVKNRLTVGLASSRNPQSPRHKTAGEYWIDTLRKTGTGFTTESTGMNSFSGKRPRDKDMPYLSTSSYLRQLAGTEKPGKNSDPTARAAPGTPAYKSQEEYYEQILEYKKQVGALNQDASNMKAKIRRLEEDNLKKEKEIDSLLHPQKSEELRRTLTDKRPDSGSVIHSLKQKILKLETQMRDKEAAYVKLQSDLKTTKIEEMKQQMEVFYNEIVRLQNSKDTGIDKSVRGTTKEGNVKIKALNETILRLNKSNEQLQNENRSLKEDLKNAMDGGTARNRDYEDMNRNELLRSINQLEKKLERAEKYADSSSLVSYESKAPQMAGKVALDGTLEDRLDQLDKRESELLEVIERKNDKIKSLSAEKNRWMKRCEDLQKDLAADDKPVRSRPPSARPSTSGTRGSRPLSARSDDRPPSARDRDVTPRGRANEYSRRPSSAKRRSSVDSGVSSVRRQKIKDFKENRSAKTIQRQWRSHRDDQKIQNDKVTQFRENRAAKKIQHQWTGYKHRKYEEEQEEYSEQIRSALMGHKTRRQQISAYETEDDDDDYITDDEEFNDCRNLIESSVLAHKQRKSFMRNYQLSSAGEDDDDEDDIGLGTSYNPRSSISSNRSRPLSAKARPTSGSLRGSGYGSSTRGYGSYSTHLGGDDDF
ncbi:hypothetical protein ACF0H5_001442 [Mactra antiquata]